MQIRTKAHCPKTRLLILYRKTQISHNRSHTNLRCLQSLVLLVLGLEATIQLSLSHRLARALEGVYSSFLFVFVVFFQLTELF